ncbi:MAG: arginase [Bacteroidota bacterium]
MKVVFLHQPSEISAGTRGASLGKQAMEVVAWKQEDDFFERHQIVGLPHQNHLLAQEWAEGEEEKGAFKWAKRVKGLIRVFEDTIPTLRDTFQNEEVFPLILGSAHGATAASLKALKAAYPEDRIGVIWVDAHGDLHSPYTSPSGNMHGMPLAMALQSDNYDHRRRDLHAETVRHWDELKALGAETPVMQPEDIILIAARDLEVQERELMTDAGIRNLPVRRVREEGAHTIAAEALDMLKDCDRIFVSFDVDSLDASISRGTGTPVPDGLLVSEAKRLLMDLAKSPAVTAIDFVEINPTLDNKGNKMAEVAFDILKNVVEILENHR